MPVAERSRRGVRCDRTLYKGFTNLYSEVYGQNKGYSQDVRMNGNWEKKKKKKNDAIQ
jgi:hypothetical protein